MSIIDRIRKRQHEVVSPGPARAPDPHRPEMLYIGCIDARLDPIDDIGIEQGHALIFRNIAALVLKNSKSLTDVGEMLNGSSIQNISVGAVLEFFLTHIDSQEKIKHIVVSGHTDCGGIRACHDRLCGAHDLYLPLYLRNLEVVRERVMLQAEREKWDRQKTLHALEEEAVRESLTNLMSYPAVQKAVQEGRAELHGWVIDTASKRILEMNPETGEFEPMMHMKAQA